MKPLFAAQISFFANVYLKRETSSFYKHENYNLRVRVKPLFAAQMSSITNVCLKRETSSFASMKTTTIKNS